jgi:hypothetical protein
MSCWAAARLEGIVNIEGPRTIIETVDFEAIQGILN